MMLILSSDQMCLSCATWPTVCGSLTVISRKMDWMKALCMCVCFHFLLCAGDEHLCVCGTGVSLHKRLWLYQVNCIWRNTSWPRCLLLGCHITHCSRAVPIICHSAYMSWCHRTYTHYIAVSCGSRYNLACQVLIQSVCSFASNSFTIYPRIYTLDNWI